MVERVVAVFRQRGDDDFLPLIKIPAGGARPAVLRSGDRMGGHELADALAEGLAGGCDNVTLGRPPVGNDGVRPEVGRDALENLGHLGHRRRDQNDVGIRDFVRRVDPGAVDDAELLRHTQRGGRPPEADHLLDRIGLLECQREGAADQAGPEDDDLAELGHARAPSPAPPESARSPVRCRSSRAAIPAGRSRQSGG